MKLPHRPSIFRQKRMWAVFACVIVILVAGLVFAGSVRQSAAFDQLGQTYDKTKVLADSLRDESKDTREKRLQAIAELARDVPSGACQADWWNDWQQSIIPAVQTSVKQCHQKLGKLQAVTKPAKELHDYLAIDTEVSRGLAKLKIDKNSKTWQKDAVAASSAVSSALADIHAPGTSEPLVEAAHSKVEAIVKAWGTLDKASSKQDKNAYLSAEGALAQAYANLGAISDVSDSQIEKLLKSLQAASSQL